MEQSVPGWYSGKSIFITGATGFMGKALLEKLIRSCPDIANVYILIRPKRGKSPEQRIEELISTPAFELVRELPNSEELLSKIKLISGDTSQPGLQISEKDFATLKKNVTVLFHMAACVKFDQPLKSALKTNTEGTMNVLDVAEQLNLKAFVHVSTSYCHCDEVELFEELYKAPHPPRKVLQLTTWMKDELLEKLTPSLLQASPNTYAYTKCLTEQLVAEYSDKIPIAIARPSIVTAAWKEPIPGWIENLNGPTGLLVGAGKGVIRSMYCKADYTVDVMPVDVAINSIILIAWKLGNAPRETNEPLVVNVCKTDENPIKWGDAVEMGKKHFYKNPFSLVLWYPRGNIKSNYVMHLLAVLFFHFIPAYFVDFLFVLFRQKPFLVKTQKRIQSGLAVLYYYTTRRWVFHNEKLKKISSELSEQDRETFYTNLLELDWDHYLYDYIMGARKYCMHEEPSTLPQARKMLRRLYILDMIVQVFLLSMLFVFLWNYAGCILGTIDSILKSTVDLIPLRY